MLVPLAFVALGIWEQQRGADDVASLERERVAASKVVLVLESRLEAANGRLDVGPRFRRGGQTYVGEIAVDQAREVLSDTERALTVARYREYLPPVMIACAAIAAALSALALISATLLGRAGRTSRDRLVGGFSLFRRLLPPLMGLQVVLGAVVVVLAITFESSALLEADSFDAGSIKMLGIAGGAVVICLVTAVKAVLQLRRTVALFKPDPLEIMGREVTRAEAPGLWRMLDGLADRLGALKPDNIVVGVTGGFFVSSGPKILQPAGNAIAGRTLYMPLPYLPLLREDEVATIIGHELAHFSGGDTEYSLRFLPIYAGVGRSLDAVALAGMAKDGSISPLTRPAFYLGAFVMEQFHHAVRHWSRLREFAADKAGADVTSTDAAGRALLRTGAVLSCIEETLGQAFRAPDRAPEDLVAATLQRAREQGLENPARHLEERQAHPTDTHPPTSQRLAALGRVPDAIMLEEAATPPPPQADERLGHYFAAPEALCRAASQDFLRIARQEAKETQQALKSAASGVAEEPVSLTENTRAGGIFLLSFAAVIAVAALALLVLAGPDMEAVIPIVIGLTGVMAAIFAFVGVLLLRRGSQPFLVLRPDDFSITGLDRPIAWDSIADLDMTVNNGRVVTRLLLMPEAPLPVRVKGGRAKVDPKQRIVTFGATPPRPYNAQRYAELIWRYRRAAAARRILAESPPLEEAPEPSHVTGV
ncbi:M48 family metalloprotease [Acetobacteraceae bacterium H6797]|nr:M48 family metalloprotease [Acetobacteraceae bacterium H6797]